MKVMAGVRILAQTARRKITPEGRYFPCYLLGHAMRTMPAVGILHDLWATAIVLEVGDKRLVWITVELAGLSRGFSDSLRSAIAEVHHIEINHINVSFTHTHSGPECLDEDSDFAEPGKGAVPGYMDWVALQIRGAVDDAFEKGLEPVHAFVATSNVEGCYSNRNGVDKPGDTSVTTIELRGEDGHTVAGAVSFACHSTVLGPQNLYVSNDLAGYVARDLESRWRVYPVVMVGAAGDMSNRLYRQGNDEAELERVGAKMMGQVHTDDASAVGLETPIVSTFRYEKAFEVDPDKKRQQYETAKVRIASAKNFDEKKVYTSALRMAELGLNAKPFHLDLECRLVDMGGIRFFIMPAELFSRFGIEIRAALGGTCPICWCYSNYLVGYLGNIDDYGASFETVASDIPAGTTELIVQEATKFIRSHVGVTA